MNLLSKSLVLFLALTIFSCKNATTNKNNDLDKMFDAVMEVHDEIMPEMSTINKSRRELQNWLKDSSSEVSDSLKKVILTNISDLQSADDSMMKWMQEFKKPKSENIVTAKAYYDSEMTRIKQVKTNFDESISNAAKLISTK